MLLEVFAVLALIILNGFLAMSEMALVSSRPARLKARAGRGDRGAEAALGLAEDPGRFLSSVQIGITLVGVLSGALSGATLGTRLAAALPALGVPTRLADEIGVGLVVVVITYLSLIVGELVPKQIALSDPEAVASRVAPAMRALSAIAMPLVWLLDRSGRFVLTLLGQSGRREASISEEEIRLLVAEAEGAGIIERVESVMIGGVMRVADRRARGLMTPRHEVVLARVGETRTEILARFHASGRSRLPLRDGGPDDIVGVLHGTDLLSAPEDAAWTTLARPAPIVLDTLRASDVIERLKASPARLLLVYDEYGHFVGVITPLDLLDAIVGGFDEAGLDEPEAFERDDGSLLVAGSMPVDELAERLGIALEKRPSYETVAGLVLDRAAELPRIGQRVTVGDWRIEVVDMDGHRIDKLLFEKVAAPVT